MKYSFLIVFVMASLIASLVSSSLYNYNAYSKENKQYPYTCVPVYGDIGKVECCTVDIDDDDIWCTTCDDTKPPSNCTEREKKVGEEQPPTENEPPIKSGDSVFPNNGGNALDESQPTNPTFNSNKGTIIDKNLAQDQPMQFSSNSEQSQESEELTETNNADTTSNAQENEDSSTSETTASFAKKGNTQNSPVPPECPKQGPIPPDCTMKPKF